MSLLEKVIVLRVVSEPELMVVADNGSLAGEKWPWPEILLGAWKRLGNRRSKNRPTLDIVNSMNIQLEMENKISAKRS